MFMQENSLHFIVIFIKSIEVKKNVAINSARNIVVLKQLKYQKFTESTNTSINRGTITYYFRVQYLLLPVYSMVAALIDYPERIYF